MTTQIEVKLGGVSDASINGGTCRNVATLTNLSGENGEIIKSHNTAEME